MIRKLFVDHKTKPGAMLLPIPYMYNIIPVFPLIGGEFDNLQCCLGFHVPLGRKIPSEK